jgi:uncharacterized Fe-S cluster-containing radical SAM superfamily protein
MRRAINRRLLLARLLPINLVARVAGVVDAGDRRAYRSFRLAAVVGEAVVAAEAVGEGLCKVL